jgi:hypothetical protein
VCISYARSASKESRIDSEDFREEKGNLDQVQGVHNVKERPSIKEPDQRNTRNVEIIFFQEILHSKFDEIPGMQGACGKSESSRKLSSEGIALFRNADKVKETNS